MECLECLHGYTTSIPRHPGYVHLVAWEDVDVFLECDRNIDIPKLWMYNGLVECNNFEPQYPEDPLIDPTEDSRA